MPLNEAWGYSWGGRKYATVKHVFHFSRPSWSKTLPQQQACDYSLIVEGLPPNESAVLRWSHFLTPLPSDPPVRFFPFRFNLRKSPDAGNLLTCSMELREASYQGSPDGGGPKILKGIEEIMEVAASRAIIAPQLDVLSTDNRVTSCR